MKKIDVLAKALRRVCLAALLLVTFAHRSLGQYCTPDQCDECLLRSQCLKCCNEPPELWVINTRSLSRCNNLDASFEKMRFERWDPQCKRFVRESRESFLAAPPVPTLFFAHGNTLKHEPAMKSCWSLYSRMRCCPGPKRLVFWSWPAQVVYKRPLLRPRLLIEKNLKIKFVYSEYQAYYMAKLVHQMDLSERVTLSGHSYGAIIAAGALHYMGGGCLRGLTLEGGMPVERPNLRGAMISGALDNDALNPGCIYGQAFVAAEKIYVTRNARDKTLDNWPKVSPRGRVALGVTGVNANLLGQYRDKLCQQTLTADVGRSHYMKPHLASTRFVSSLCCIAFPACGACLQQGANEGGTEVIMTEGASIDSAEFEGDAALEEMGASFDEEGDSATGADDADSELVDELLGA